MARIGIYHKIKDIDLTKALKDIGEYPSPYREGKRRASVYQLNPPFKSGKKFFQYVILSSVDLKFKVPDELKKALKAFGKQLPRIVETKVFPCSKNAKHVSFYEIFSSSSLDHEKVLRDMGYEEMVQLKPDTEKHFKDIILNV